MEISQGGTILERWHFGKNCQRHQALKTALGAYIALRIMASLWIALLVMVFPSSAGADGILSARIDAPYLSTINPISRTLLVPWYRWDTVRYLNIATLGYSADLNDTVWPPLFPALIWLVGIIIPNPLLASLIVSNCAAIIAFYLLYIIVAEYWNDITARRTILILVIFPTAFFLIAGYAESLFVVFSLAVLRLIQHRKWWLTGMFAALAAITRVQGIFLMLPIVWEIYQWHRGEAKWKWKVLVSQIFAGFAAPLAYGLYAFAVHYELGAVWPWQSLENGWNLHFDWPWMGFWGNLTGLISPLSRSQLPIGNGVYDLCLGLLACGLLIAGWNRVPVPFLLYGWAVFLPAIMKVTERNYLISTSRYVLVLFPIMIMLALKLRNKWVWLTWFALSVASQLIFLLWFYLKYFIG
ncbi:MAG: mannosyltransferase family protein [Anaerolineaceae bacterium]|nr:mannosyltransferase family protein [Anaerolineaceae bacterium]